MWFLLSCTVITCAHCYTSVCVYHHWMRLLTILMQSSSFTTTIFWEHSKRHHHHLRLLFHQKKLAINITFIFNIFAVVPVSSYYYFSCVLLFCICIGFLCSLCLSFTWIGCTCGGKTKMKKFWVWFFAYLLFLLLLH